MITYNLMVSARTLARPSRVTIAVFRYRYRASQGLISESHVSDRFGCAYMISFHMLSTLPFPRETLLVKHKRSEKRNDRKLSSGVTRYALGTNLRSALSALLLTFHFRPF